MSKVYRDPLEPTPLEEYINEHGHEVPNPVPVAPPVGFVRGPSMVDHIRSMVRSELLRREVEAAGVESFEDADDFDIEDDPLDPSTQYESVFDPVPDSAPVKTLPHGAEATRTPPVGGASPAGGAGSPPAPPVPPSPGAPAPSVAPSKDG